MGHPSLRVSDARNGSPPPATRVEPGAKASAAAALQATLVTGAPKVAPLVSEHAAAV